MYNMIANSFFQRKSCVLPGIGKLLLVTHPSSTDFTNRQMTPPVQEIVFTPAGTNEKIFFNEFSAISELMKKKLDEEDIVELEGIGVFTKDNAGDIKFTPVQLDESMLIPVKAVKVAREYTEHAILVGDKETTSTEMTDLLSEKEPAKDKWWVWAAVLGAAGIIILAIYLSRYGINAFGNAT